MKQILHVQALIPIQQQMFSFTEFIQFTGYMSTHSRAYLHSAQLIFNDEYGLYGLIVLAIR